MLNKGLTVVLTRTRERKPLAVIRNLPGLEAELTPHQMRMLARALSYAADACEARPMGKKSFMEAVRVYPLVPMPEDLYARRAAEVVWASPR